ncbi:MAG TPA: hypothetical protein VFA04_16115 [Bryobacteraceae bacterium]|nr:hypothetical protein [Bryobacteraceae bacterium]
MWQTIHIFKKDVRHLWAEIAVVLMANAAFVFGLVQQTRGGVGAAQGIALTLITYLLPFAWTVLVARAIYGETLVGTRQFWITRPYAWRSLLAAKALFVIVTVSLPKLIADAVVLRAFGFSLAPQVAGLLWAQLLVIAWLALPVAALAAVTTGVVQLIAALSITALAVVALTFVLSGSNAGAPWLALEWTRSYAMLAVIAVAAIMIIVRQYKRQGTLISRTMAAVSFLAAFAAVVWLPWTAAFALQSRLSQRKIDNSALHVDFDSALRSTTRVIPAGDGSVALDVPLRVGGIPEFLVPRAEGITATIEGPRGHAWRSDRDARIYVRSTDTNLWFHASLPNAFYQTVRNDTVRIRGLLYFTLYGNGRQVTLPLEDRPHFLITPGVGLCSALRTRSTIWLTCRSALKSRADEVVFNVVRTHSGDPATPFNTISYPHTASFSPFAADDPLIANDPLVPIKQTSLQAPLPDDGTGVTAYAIEPVAYIRKDFDMNGLRLGDFEAPLPAP